MRSDLGRAVLEELQELGDEEVQGAVQSVGVQHFGAEINFTSVGFQSGNGEMHFFRGNLTCLISLLFGHNNSGTASWQKNLLHAH